MNIEQTLEVEMSAARALMHAIAESIDGDDQQLVADMLEGETGLMEAVDAALARITELGAMQSAIADIIGMHRARRDRLIAAEERLRSLIHQAMIEAHLRKLERPTATVSLRASVPRVDIVDPASIPADYVVPQEPKINKAAIARALKDGQQVPGAALLPGEQSVSIRFS